MKLKRLLLAGLIISMCACERPKSAGQNDFKDYVSVPKSRANDVKTKLEAAQNRAAEQANEAAGE